MDEFKAFAKKYPGFTGFIAFCILLFIGGVVFYFMASGSAGEAEQRYEQAKDNRDFVLNHKTAPTKENLELAKSNVAALNADLENKKAQVTGSDTVIIQEQPADSNRMFLDLNKFVSDYTAVAAELVLDKKTLKYRPNVIIPEHFQFGWGYIINVIQKGPPEEHIRDVYIQKQALDHMLKAFFTEPPYSIINIQRTPVIDPSVLGKDKKHKKTIEGLFYIDELTSARQPGAIKTLGFRIDFIGYTDTLQALLLSLPEFPLPLVVRSVEVDQVGPDDVEKEKPDEAFDFPGFGSDEGSVVEAIEHIVEENLSKFSVIVELIRVQEDAPENAAEPPAKEDEGGPGDPR